MTSSPNHNLLYKAYKALVGLLVYAANGTRFDITAAVSIVSRKRYTSTWLGSVDQFLRANPKKLKYKKVAESGIVTPIKRYEPTDNRYTPISSNSLPRAICEAIFFK